MKRISLIILLAAITLSGMAQTIGEAFYIYRNDGQFNAFFRDEVQAIEYSYYDADSIKYEEIVTQVVITADSVYKIPLAAIDSVGFVQPENVLKSGTISLTGSILDYLVKVEGVYLYFLSNTPSDILPRVGDKLVTIDMTELFPCGYAGEVVAVDNRDGYKVVECSGLELEDVYDSYSYVMDYSPDDENAQQMMRAPNVDRTINIPRLSHSWGLGVGTPLFDVDGTVESSLVTRFNIKGIDLVDSKRGHLTNIRVTGNYTTGISYEIGIGSSEPFDFPFPGGRGERPIAPLLSFFWDFGVFVGVSGSVTYSQSFTQQYVSHIDYQREGTNMPYITFDRPEMIGCGKSDARLALKGSVSGGFYGELGVKPWALDKNSDFGGKVSGRLEIGVEAEMERGIDIGGLEGADRNTALYDCVDNAGDLTLPSLTISPYASVTVTIKVGPWNTHWTPWKGKFGSPIYKGGFFPHFSNTRYERTSDSGSITFSSDLSRTCLFPWQIGFSVFDMNDNFIKTEYFDRTYRDPYQFDTYEVTIGDLEKDGEYKVYPSINVFDHHVLASPYVIVTSCPVKLSDFKITNSQYKEGGFTNDGMTYDYRFDVSVTATLDDGAEDISDWGYVYLDPNGREKEISLVEPSGYGNSYTDARWAYFRNEAKSTCMLYGYVKYIGSDDIVYGEPHNYSLEYEAETSCPDHHHPHWIDLGIGTLWRCCNVGASKPDEYGSYYTFDEALAYNPPTINQIQTLIEKCSYTWTTQNGIAGGKFTGPNGVSIFLPAAGFFLYDGFGHVGIRGYYQSATPEGEDDCYILGFNCDWAYWGHLVSRKLGQSVRPVCIVAP